MFNKILIANRGEIACRVIKTAHRLGIKTVAVYSDADQHALHVSMADEAIHIGPSPSAESYLRIDRIIDAAKETGAEAVHPGYGFLSENAEFCNACKNNNIIFIGPPIDAITSMGSKSMAKQIMEDADVPILPGYHGNDGSIENLKRIADEMTYPVLIKAVMGGGGKGMRLVEHEQDFDRALDAARREARSSFGNDEVLIEKYLIAPRHVEIQIFCDQHGKGVYLFERDCSIQRRHQKVIEEAPAPRLDEAIRSAMGNVALKAAHAINYIGAGTIEFLLNKNNDFYFMEMNTRLQVEHPVTEMITGLDLVEWQLRIAAGEALPCSQDQLRIHGHAIETRIYAEDTDNDFLPSTGTLLSLQAPQENRNVRVDTGVVQGNEISMHYDPMIAKLIVWDEDRDKAQARMATALSQYAISGVSTNIHYLYNLITCEPFKQAQLETEFIQRHEQTLSMTSQDIIDNTLPLAGLYLLLRRQQDAINTGNNNDLTSPWHTANGWRMNAPNIYHCEITIKGTQYSVTIKDAQLREGQPCQIHFEGRTVQASGSLENNVLHANVDGHRLKVTIMPDGDFYSVFTEHGVLEFAEYKPDYDGQDKLDANAQLTAPMTGTIIDIPVKLDTQVRENEVLLVMEAMKMEYTLRAPVDGRVTRICYAVGDQVEARARLLEFEPDVLPAEE